jgi:hypothetical protein
VKIPQLRDKEKMQAPALLFYRTLRLLSVGLSALLGEPSLPGLLSLADEE